MAQKQIRKGITEAREALYSLFSAAFYIPEPDILSQDFRLAFKEAASTLNWEEHHKQATTFIKDLTTGKDCGTPSLRDLKLDYSRLFLGPSSLLAPPYESFYRDGGRTMGESTLEVISAYRSAGMVLDPEFKDLPDHIAVELNFLSFLCGCERRVQAGEEGSIEAITKRERDFLTDHLLRWLAPFSQRVEKYAELEFYSRITQLLKLFIAEEQRFLM